MATALKCITCFFLFGMSTSAIALRLAKGDDKTIESPLAGGRVHHVFSQNGLNDVDFHGLRVRIFDAVRTSSSPGSSLLIGLGDSAREGMLETLAARHDMYVIEAFPEFIEKWKHGNPRVRDRVHFVNAAAGEKGQNLTIGYHGVKTTVPCVPPADVIAVPLSLTSIDIDGGCNSCVLKNMAQTQDSSVELFFIELSNLGEDSHATLELLDRKGYALFDFLTVGLINNQTKLPRPVPEENVWPKTQLADSSSIDDFLNAHLKDATHLSPRWTDVIAVKRDLLTHDVLDTFSQMNKFSHSKAKHKGKRSHSKATQKGKR